MSSKQRVGGETCPRRGWNHLKYYTSLDIRLWNNGLHFIWPRALLSGRLPSQWHCLPCPTVHICHMSKAAPVPEYVTRLSAEQLRLGEDRAFVFTDLTHFMLLECKKWWFDQSKRRKKQKDLLGYINMEDSGNDYAIYPLTCSPRRAKKRKKEVHSFISI